MAAKRQSNKHKKCFVTLTFDPVNNKTINVFFSYLIYCQNTKFDHVDYRSTKKMYTKQTDGQTIRLGVENRQKTLQTHNSLYATVTENERQSESTDIYN